ncbi:hypothetical protein [Streptomyces afghaniensis]|uniref:hypothetical protein n=1 Tax=Streptomyces afghaniensis TaxID=66865 RepID=UPI0027898561|nr:hypothetical protein [Streptomyces afghaniensis]MDQ1020499.1 hypothetical protein [Streptomyces afghaniensis]
MIGAVRRRHAQRGHSHLWGAIERDDEAIEVWKAEVWPRVWHTHRDLIVMTHIQLGTPVVWCCIPQRRVVGHRHPGG